MSPQSPRPRKRGPSLAYAFTEHGAIMAATILSSPRAIEMSVYVVRAFVQLREMLASNRELARRFAQLETTSMDALYCAAAVPANHFQ
jgi:hypothetical protein